MGGRKPTREEILSEEAHAWCTQYGANERFSPGQIAKEIKKRIEFPFHCCQCGERTKKEDDPCRCSYCAICDIKHDGDDCPHEHGGVAKESA